MFTAPSYPITGIQKGFGPASGQVPLRVEVDDFFKQDQYSIQLNLFFLAMVKFQAIPYGETLSYFQVAGKSRWNQMGSYHNLNLILPIVASLQVFTVCPTYRGTLGLLEDIILSTVNTVRFCLVLGIDLTWLFLRCIFVYFTVPCSS
jgi:tyrosinase